MLKAISVLMSMAAIDKDEHKVPPLRAWPFYKCYRRTEVCISSCMAACSLLCRISTGKCILLLEECDQTSKKKENVKANACLFLQLVPHPLLASHQPLLVEWWVELLPDCLIIWSISAYWHRNWSTSCVWCLCSLSILTVMKVSVCVCVLYCTCMSV